MSTARPRFGWKLPADFPGKRQHAYQIIVASQEDRLNETAADVWNSGRISGRQSWLVPYSGATLASGRAYHWQVRIWSSEKESSEWSDPARFELGLLRNSDWNGHWISLSDDMGTPIGRHYHVPAMTDAALTAWHQVPERRRASFCARGSFEIDAAVEEAWVHLCGLGHYQLWCNGQRVGRDELQPAWSDYERRCYANTYPLTSYLKPGRNVIAILVGNGFFNVAGGAGRYAKLHVSFGAPKLRLDARLQLADGSSQRFVTDATWRVHASAITFNCIYGGEDFDARLHDDRWTTPDFDDADWPAATLTTAPIGLLEPQTSAPLTHVQRHDGHLLRQIRTDLATYDLQQNHAGMPDLLVSGPAGSQVRLTPGESLTPEGLVDQGSASGPNSRGKTYFNYTLRGGPEREHWTPSFSYYGYRYLQAELLPPSGGTALPSLHELGSWELQSCLPTVGTWTSSHPLLNRVHALVLAAARSNLQHVLTDCPHREKLGWLEVSYLMGPSLAFNYDLHAFLHKVTGDMIDAQQPDGLIPNHAPEYCIFDEGAPGYSDRGFRDSPEWGSAVFHLTELCHRWYGDDEIVRRNYGAMVRFMEYLLSLRKDGILNHGLSDWMDASPPDGSLPGTCQLTGRGLTATATLIRDLKTLERLATLTGRTDESTRWSALADETRIAFNRHFFNPATSVYDTCSQTALAMPLALDLVESPLIPLVVQRLRERIERDGFEVRTGDIGHVYLIDALSRHGCNELMWKLVTHPTPPSYGGMIASGATTLTEDWNADPRLSLNHLMLGHIEQWFYQHLAGLQPECGDIAWCNVPVRPWFAPGLSHISATHESPHGCFAVSWQRQSSGGVNVTLTVPPNTAAHFFPPDGFVLTSHANPPGTKSLHLDPGQHHLNLVFLP